MKLLQAFLRGAGIQIQVCGADGEPLSEGSIEELGRFAAKLMLAAPATGSAPGDREDAERYRFLRDNPLQLRAIDGNSTWYDKPAAYFDDHTDRAMVDAARRAASRPTGETP